MTEFVRQLILASCQEQFAKSIDFPWLFDWDLAHFH